jgi:hypothetical protein
MRDEFRAARLQLEAQLSTQLSTLPLFQTSRPEHLRDVRSNVPKIKQENPCQDYARLLEHLASAPFLVGVGWAQQDLSDRITLAIMFDSILDIKFAEFERVYRFLRKHNLLPADFSRRHRDSSVAHAFVILHGAHDAIFRSRPFPSHFIRKSLLQMMFKAFEQYGPTSYSDAAIYAAMAHVLRAVGIPNNKETTFTPGTIQRTLHRST